MGFKALEGETAIIAVGGVFKQCDLFTWDGKLFAKTAGGFVRLKADGSTSKDKMRLEHLEYDGPLYRDRFGRLCVDEGDGHVRMIAQPDGKIEPFLLTDKTQE